MMEIRSMSEDELRAYLPWLNETRREEKEIEFTIPTVHPGKVSDKEIHEKMCTEIHHMFTEKNKRYGNSFSEQFSEFGILSLIIRLNDKLNRLKTLTKNPEIGATVDESIEDTLKDLANYAIMGLVELHKKERGVK